jgi:murein DD-endopeptidase MepM/ murein hydrolase activator NlpD
MYFNMPYLQLMFLSLLVLLSSGCSRGMDEPEIEIIRGETTDVSSMTEEQWIRFKNNSINDILDRYEEESDSKAVVEIEDLSPTDNADNAEYITSPLFAHRNKTAKEIAPKKLVKSEDNSLEKVERFSQKTIKPQVRTSTRKNWLPPSTVERNEETIVSPVLNKPQKKTLIAWPVKGSIVSPYGAGPKGTNNGINIETQPGTLVRSAADGKVFHVGSIKKIGKVIVIQHTGKTVTVYSNIKNVKVEKGIKVKKGTPIASVLDNIRNRGELHFEVRKEGQSVDPTTLLP